MRHLILVLGFSIIVLVFIAGCTSNSVKESDIQRTIPSLSLPPTTVTQSTIVTSTIIQTKTYIVAITVQRKGNNIVITDQGGQDQNMLSELHYGINTADHQWNSPKIGETVTLIGGASGRDQVIVVGTFTNEVKQVLLDTYV
jgi:hypothetical protein